MDFVPDRSWGALEKLSSFLKYMDMVSKRGETGFRVLVTKNLIDLFWTEHRRQEIILKSLAEQLDPDTFAPFKTAFHHYETYLEKAQRDADVEHQLMTRTRQAFLDCYGKLQADHILLTFDTAEEASEPAILFLVEFLPEMYRLQPNTRVVIAGRERSDQQQVIDKFPSGSVKKIDLHGLNDKEVAQYFSDKGYEFDADKANQACQTM